MMACWHEDPNQRPNFDSIVVQLDDPKKVVEPPVVVNMTPKDRVYYNFQ